MIKVKDTPYTLRELYKKTSFTGKEHPVWDGIIVGMEKDSADEDVCYVYVPECSYFDDTQICLPHASEESGEDCLFVQELIRLYREGKLVEKT